MDNRTLLLHISEWLGIIAVTMLFSLSPKLKKHKLAFRFPQREGLVSLGLFALLLLFTLIYYSSVFSSALPDWASLNTLTSRLIISGICLVPIVLALIIRGQPVRSAGWDTTLTATALRAALVLSFLTIILQGKFFRFFTSLTQADAFSLLMWLGISMADESVFRGYIQPRLTAWLGNQYGWLVTAAMYTLWQIPRLLTTPAASLPINLALTAVQALVLGWIMKKSGHVLASGIYRAISEWLWMLT